MFDNRHGLIGWLDLANHVKISSQKKEVTMALIIGIIGLPNVGKSTTFNALTEDQLAAADNYPFCTIP